MQHQHRHPDPQLYTAAVQHERDESAGTPPALVATIPLLVFIFALFVWLSPRRG